MVLDSRLHHEVGGGVLVPAHGEAGLYLSLLLVAVDLLPQLVYQPQQRGPGDFALGEEAVGETAKETCPYWSQFQVAADLLLHLVYQPQYRGPGDFAHGEEAVGETAEETCPWPTTE